MARTQAELEEDVRRAMALITDLTTRLAAAEATATDARTEARNACAEAARATTALAHTSLSTLLYFGAILFDMVYPGYLLLE